MKIGIVGAGLMGAEIAFIFARAGQSVLLNDRSEEALHSAIARLDRLYEKGVGRGFYEAGQKEAVLGCIETTVDRERFVSCDFITEAVFEREDVKADVFHELDEICRSDCIFATNTSTIPISALATHVREARRSRFVGTHYFSPVSRMKLVEIIPAFDTSSETLDFVKHLCSEAGKTPVEIRDVTGFAVNRLLHIFMIEAVRLVEEGVATPEQIDTVCRLGLGHPMGPFELMDATTSSLCLQAQEIMHEAYGERFRPRPLMKQRVRAGLVGGAGRPGWRSSGSR
ncbi:MULTISPECIES: 3-hydroxyacyl-CoA dehydrogenase family protein [unclassified Bradyrhizobium]|uniref:3-hydroxyacyl-CoA dehydrogenase family protein n=1 Tax=unclassified Bradyrhizobium TaxID=2631580 RepID=UPI003390CA8C